MKAPLDAYKILKIEPTTDLDIINKAYYARTYEIHMHQLDNPETQIIDDLQQISSAFEKVNTSEKLSIYYQQYSFNNFLLGKKDCVGFFKQQSPQEVTGYLSVSFTEGNNDSPISSVFSLPKLNKEEQPKVNMKRLVKTINYWNSTSTLEFTLNKEKTLQIINAHSFEYPQLLVLVKIPSTLISSRAMSENELYARLEHKTINASVLRNFWLPIGCNFEEADILEIVPMARNEYKNTSRFNFDHSCLLWPQDYRYKMGEDQNSLIL